MGEHSEYFGGELTLTQQAYLIRLVETAGDTGAAAEAAGVHRSTPHRWEHGWPRPGGLRTDPSPAYLAALGVARELASETLEQEALRRGFEGVRRYKFNGGKPVLNPEKCECGHGLRGHARPRKPDHVPEGEEVDQEIRPCLECSCEDFHGAPYFEHEYSDKLLLALLAARKPREYGTKRIERTLPIDWDRLPDHLVARIARGEDAHAVIASAAEDGVRLLASGAELGGPLVGDDD
jgi:hypothetical protein